VPGINPASQQQNNIFYWSNGSVMATTGTVNRQNVDIQDVPKAVQEDFMAAEDESFETNSGVDPMSILRAVKNMATGGDIQSGSTITQQWVKNSVLGDSQQTVSRKFKEIIISVKIGRGAYTKPEVLQAYLNSSYYGRSANGIEAAAEAYYHVHASQLTPSEGAFIAATVNEPSYYQNISSDKTVQAKAVSRWTYVLNRMVVNHWMTAADRAQLTPDKFPMPVAWGQNSTLSGQVGYLVQTAQTYVEQHSTPKLTDKDFANGGYRIYTTFDKTKVDQMSAGVAKMEKDHINAKKRPKTDTDIQTGSAAVDPSTGAIVAIYGGAGEDKGYYNNNANSTGVPVGSTFKPIVMAAALENGAILTPNSDLRSPITPDSKFNGDDNIEIRDQQGNLIMDGNKPLLQQNDDNSQPGFITLRTAMENSVNTPYVQLGEDVGYDKVEAMALKLGLDHTILTHDTAGFFIGTSTPSAIRMANVYATFADGGIEHDPYSVTKITRNAYGPSYQPELAKPQSTRAMSASTADTINSMLQDVVKYGSGTSVLGLDRPVAGKTGTTDDYKSALFIGYTPQLSTAVMMFRENPSKQTLLSMRGVGGFALFYGRLMPAEVWLNFMQAALGGTPVADFPAAPSLPKGANESGAPTPTPSATATKTAPPSSTAPPSTAPPTATGTPSAPATSPTASCQFPAGVLCPPTEPTSTSAAPGDPGGPDTPSAKPPQ
jgi:membrane peptidoglycan carboxypeptidase